MAVRYYPGVLERVSDGFSIFFPDLPGCVSAGDSVEQTVAHAEQAVAMHLAGLLEDDQAIPAPTPLEQLARDPEVEEYARVLVRADIPGKVQRINITMDEGLLAAADAAAKRRGQSRSAFLAEAVRGALRAA